VGGTEIYVEQLSHEQARLGLEPMIAAPAAEDSSSTHAGLAVRRFATTLQPVRLRELYDADGDSLAAHSFAALLARERPQVVHFHAFHRAVSLRSVAAARQAGAATLFTYHLPTASCQRGTLLRWGRQVCDGLLLPSRCTSCTLHGLGMPQAAATLLGQLPRGVSDMVEASGRTGGLWTALQMRVLVEARHDAVRGMLAQVDAVVALCRWSQALLLRNGVAATKITLSPHGLADSSEQTAPSPQRPTSGPLRIAFVGRMYPIKGPDLLIKAVQGSLSDVQLDLYGYSQDEAGAQYTRSLHTLAGSDSRIAFHPALPNQQVRQRLSSYDLLAVPSQWLETGPLVVLEAFAGGTPVLGSNLGGIAELVRDGVDGVLVEPASTAAWRDAITALSTDRSRVATLRAGVRPPRRMAQVATEMLALYRRIQTLPRELLTAVGT